MPRGDSPVWAGNHMIYSHAEAGFWSQVTARQDEHVTIAPAVYKHSKNNHHYNLALWNLQIESVALPTYIKQL